MIPNCTTAPGMEGGVGRGLAGSLDELRLRMVRDLELFLSYALTEKGEARPTRMVSRLPKVPGEPVVVCVRER
ncbi:MAG: hypothetical protein ACM359_09860 [Bacillota bacterium]